MGQTYLTQAIWGDAPNTSIVSADILSDQAADSTDWGAVISNGIKGAAQGAISGLVRANQQDQQIRTFQAQQAAKSQSLINLLLVFGAFYLLVK